MAGNTQDRVTLRDFLARIEQQYGKAHRIWVVDRGIPTEEVLQEMRGCDPPMRYLAGTPKGRLTRYDPALWCRPLQFDPRDINGLGFDDRPNPRQVGLAPEINPRAKRHLPKQCGNETSRTKQCVGLTRCCISVETTVGQRYRLLGNPTGGAPGSGHRRPTAYSVGRCMPSRPLLRVQFGEPLVCPILLANGRSEPRWQ
jgi:hypothetical protein